jgi:hypothetical protein
LYYFFRYLEVVTCKGKFCFILLLLDPVSDFGSGIRKFIESESNQDPQPWLDMLLFLKVQYRYEVSFLRLWLRKN